ncbi:hypothetical protein [Salipaludibacillus agaradhaerens]|uniref:hypothetical protein n=1 Tax=Salipaludibacillus agaradhaerens TaxID=76935 RepID=UPI00117F8F9A|nr:hypothetical protein [Salipaludibacillus agaradhaerens]
MMLDSKAKYFVFVALGLTLMVVTYFIMMSAINAEQQIKDKVIDLDPLHIDVLHVELVEKDYAIAFYERVSFEAVGVVELEKTLFGWKVISVEKIRSGVLEGRTAVHHSQLTKRTILKGDMYTDFDDVIVKTADGRTYETTITEKQEGLNIWFLIVEDEGFSGATVKVYGGDGETIEEVSVSNPLN